MRYEKIHLKDRFPFLGDNGRDPVLEIYLQDAIRAGVEPRIIPEHEKRPCLLVCPGGGYWSCSRREAEPVVLNFLPAGFNAFILSYSTNGDNHFPTQLREVAAAMELITENAVDWRCDPERIAIAGFSAGGHLAAHYSNYYHCKEVRELFPESKKVAACLLGYPVITADPDHCHRGSIEQMAGYFPIKEEDLPKFSCEYQVTENTPPTFIWHTAEDALVPVENSLFYATALSKHKVPFECHIYPYGCHGRSTADLQSCLEIEPGMEYLHDWLTAAKKWLKMVLKMQ